MAYLKVNGFHTSTTGRADGIGAFLQKVDAAGVPFLAYCVGGTTSLVDAQNIMRQSSVPHNAIFRQDRFPHNQGGSDVPDYNLPPAEAARLQWESHVARWPADLDPTLIWGETVNELRKEVEWADWIGEFCYETGKLALDEGWKWCGPGYSAGTPELGAWETPGMLKFLRLCAAHPEQVAVALHEYSLEPEDITYQWHFHIGRFQKINDTCARFGIAPPTIFMTEWGWGERAIPKNVDEALSQILLAGELYAQYPNVKGAAIWALDGGWGSLNEQVHRLMKPLAILAAEVRYDVDAVPVPDPEPVDPDPEEEAEARNLLVNPSFEGNHNWEEFVWFGTTSHVPEGWKADWFMPGVQVDDWTVSGVPECRLMSQDPAEDERPHLPPDEWRGEENALILDGVWTYKVFSKASRWAYRLKQTAEGAKPNQLVRFTVPVNVHFDERPDNYDPHDTRFKVSANGVVAEFWMNKGLDRSWIYPTVTARADASGRVRCEIYMSVKYEHHTAFFLDDVRLVPVAETAPEPEEQDPPETHENGRGAPRLQYARRYLLAPQNATLERFLEICREAFETKSTVGFSADDGGIGDLDRRTVVAYDLTAEERGTYSDWFHQHYPGVVVEFRDGPGDEPGGASPPDPEPDPQFSIPDKRTDMPIVIDVSKWQDRNRNGLPDDLDFKVLRKQGGVKGTIIRTSDGVTVDPLYAGWVDRNTAAGLPHGNYHRLSMHFDVYQQFKTFMEARVDGLLGDWLDVEVYGSDVPTAEQVKTFMGLYEEATGRQIGIYTNKNTWWYNLKRDHELHEVKRPFWVAEYEASPFSYGNRGPYHMPPPLQVEDWGTDNEHLRFWQFGVMKLPGAPAPIDVNHFHGSVKEFDYLYPAAPYEEERPAERTAVLPGLHAGADGGKMSSAEFEEFMALKPGVVKFLSSQAPESVADVARAFPAAEYIVRAFLDFGGRSVTPEKFCDWTLPDVQRTLGALSGKSVWVELHNEPNLTAEGLGSSWANGEWFSEWFLLVLDRYQRELPDAVRFLFPGLSPGGPVPGVRSDSLQFLDAAQEAVAEADGLAIHAYWSGLNGWPMSKTLEQMRPVTRRWRTKPIWVTEASNNKGGVSAAQKAKEYAAFIQALGVQSDFASVRGVTFFVASASNPAWWWTNGGTAETWVGSKLGALVRAELGR